MLGVRASGLRTAVLAACCACAVGGAAAQDRTAVPGAARDALRPAVPVAEPRQIDPSVPRVALLVGNGAYRHAPRLDIPERDVRLLCRRFARLGFDVECLENAGSREQMRAAIGRFLARMPAGAVALFYFAGHGVQDRGENYLLPVDANIGQLDDVSAQGLPLGDLMQAVSGHRPALNLVFIDACRENMVDQVGGQALPRGLAAVDAPPNTMVFYSTAPGRLALDRGTGAAAANSPFAHELLRRLDHTGVPIEETFKGVIAGVQSATGGRQVPWVNSSFAGGFCFGPCAQVMSGADLQRVSDEKQRIDAEKQRISAEKQDVERRLRALEGERAKRTVPPPPPAF